MEEGIAIGVVVLMIAVYSVCYAIFLKIGLKVQKLDGEFKWLLLASFLAALAEVLADEVILGFGGRWISLGILYYFINKFTDAEPFPDGLLAIIIAWGGTMIVGTVLFVSLAPDITPNMEDEQAMEEFIDDMNELEREAKMAATSNAIVATNIAATNAVITNAATAETPSPAAVPTPAAKQSEQKTPNPMVAPPTVPADTRRSSVLSLKGITGSRSKPLALIHSGVKSYTYGVGDKLTMQLPDKSTLDVTVIKIEGKSVVISILGEEEKRTLYLKE